MPTWVCSVWATQGQFVLATSLVVYYRCKWNTLVAGNWLLSPVCLQPLCCENIIPTSWYLWQSPHVTLRLISAKKNLDRHEKFFSVQFIDFLWKRIQNNLCSWRTILLLVFCTLNRTSWAEVKYQWKWWNQALTWNQTLPNQMQIKYCKINFGFIYESVEMHFAKERQAQTACTP